MKTLHSKTVWRQSSAEIFTLLSTLITEERVKRKPSKLTLISEKVGAYWQNDKAVLVKIRWGRPQLNNHKAKYEPGNQIGPSL